MNGMGQPVFEYMLRNDGLQHVSGLHNGVQLDAQHVGPSKLAVQRIYFFGWGADDDDYYFE